MNHIVKEMLETASSKAVELAVLNRVYHAQLTLIDKKTKLICLRFLKDAEIEPVERELLAADLVRLQAVRNEVVHKVLSLNTL